MAKSPGRSEIDIYEDPKAMEAIRYYTDPLLPTFGNKAASAAAAGTGVTVFNRNQVGSKIKEILAERAEASRNVLDYLGTYTADAARELVRQLSTGRDLEMVDPEPFFRLAGKDNKTAEAMIRHNKTVLEATKERRAAAIEILRQQIGTPEQRVRVTRDNDPTPLNDLDDDKLEELSKVISSTLKERQPQAPVEEEPEAVVDADYEVVD